MGVRTTPFRRIVIYIAEHSKCYNEVGLPENFDTTMIVDKIVILPNNKAEIHFIEPSGLHRRLVCDLFD